MWRYWRARTRIKVLHLISCNFGRVSLTLLILDSSIPLLLLTICVMLFSWNSFVLLQGFRMMITLIFDFDYFWLTWCLIMKLLVESKVWPSSIAVWLSLVEIVELLVSAVPVLMLRNEICVEVVVIGVHK